MHTYGVLVLATAGLAAAADFNTASGEHIAQTVARMCAGADSTQRRQTILSRLDELKLKYQMEEFCSGSACGVNVVVEPVRPGTKTVMLGAHYDRVRKGRGAVDDAAGVAAVLELLAAFKNRPLGNLALAAAFFDLEEAGLLGSKAYVSARGQRGGLPALYLNFDVFAYGDTLGVVTTAADSLFAGAVRTAAAGQKFPLVIASQAPPGDDRSFRQAGVEAVGLGLVPQAELETIQRFLRGEQVTTKPSLAVVHTDEDTPDKVKGDEVARALRVVEAAIRATDAGN